MESKTLIGDISSLRCVGKTLVGNPIMDCVVSSDEGLFTARTKSNSPAGYQLCNNRTYKLTYHLSKTNTMIIEYAKEI